MPVVWSDNPFDERLMFSKFRSPVTEIHISESFKSLYTIVLNVIYIRYVEYYLFS